MSLKALGKLFIGLGLGLLVYGLAMDTSVSTGYGRIVNIGLANDRLMFILIGGFIFVGGVILFGVFKAKQTKEDELAEQQAIDARSAERKAQAMKISQSLASKVPKDNLIWRFAHGLGLAFLIGGLLDGLIHPPFVLVLLVYVVFIGLALRPMEYRTVISQGWLLGAVAMAYLAVHTFFSGRMMPGWRPWILWLITVVIFCLVSLRYRKTEKTHVSNMKS